MCGIDIGKAGLVATIRVPSGKDPARRAAETRSLCVDFAASSKLSENLDHPFGPFGYTMSCTRCMTVSLADGGMGLGAMWGEQKAQGMLSDAGFTSIEAAHVVGDIATRISLPPRAEPIQADRYLPGQPSASAARLQ